MSSSYKNKQWLVDRFIYQGYSIEQMAMEAQVTTMTIRNWLKEFNVIKNNGRK